MNYIEAAARAVENMACALAREGRKSDRYGFCGHARCGHFHEAADAIRALAHAARGEGEERPVHRDDEWWIRRINEAHKHGGLPWLVTVAKNFPRDEGASATPPPATGEAWTMDAVRDAWRDSRGCPQWGWDDFREAIRRRALPEAREGKS